MDGTNDIGVEALSEPLKLAHEVYLSEEFARAEREKLWPYVWQHVARVEELPNVGDFITYDIGEESILVVRSTPDLIKAFYNVCSHRGRQLVDAARGAHSAHGKRKLFVCGYHGWRYDLDGKCVHMLDQDDWGCALTDERTRLGELRVDTWGGWIWVNMNPNCEPLREYLEPAARLLDPFELERMRYRWRQWIVFECNWKVAIEAFMESYHVASTHPQLNKYGDFYTTSRAQGLHGNNGFDSRNRERNQVSSATVARTGKGGDPRAMIDQMQQEFWETIGASTTPTFVEAAARLRNELPEATPAADVHKHWFEAARRDDAARGVIWPTLEPEKVTAAGLAWAIFPNMSILHGPTFALCYRARPYGASPDQCLFEAYAIERFPDGEAPNTEWVYAESDDVAKWRLVLTQDFSNMRAVQRGMKSRGFRGPLPNPQQERKVTNFHRNLARYVGAGAPQLLSKR
jgi:phenylpropionate dioxygenase-like ring-hydroxylating dioxygenase large terminal subunit